MGIKLEFGEGDMGTDKNNDKGKIEFVNGSSVEFIPPEGESIRGQAGRSCLWGTVFFTANTAGKLLK